MRTFFSHIHVHVYKKKRACESEGNNCWRMIRQYQRLPQEWMNNVNDVYSICIIYKQSDSLCNKLPSSTCFFITWHYIYAYTCHSGTWPDCFNLILFYVSINPLLTYSISLLLFIFIYYIDNNQYRMEFCF